MTKEIIEELAHEIIDSSIVVHKELGPGLLESIYQTCMMEELKRRKIQAHKEVVVPVFYRGIMLQKELRIDILVENQIILEIKAIEAIAPIHVAQILTYLKLADKRLGFVLNFNVTIMKNGIKRVINGIL